MHIGTAGWSIPRESVDAFPGAGQHLERYARVLSCVEVNSSFHRSHRHATWQRWAAQTPPAFRFAVKLPRSITHDARLRGAREPLGRFLDESAGLGDKRAVLLVQLPPSLAFEARVAADFFGLLRESHRGAIVCEPRHATWFEEEADRAMIEAQVTRVAADPARWPVAARPGGWLGPDGDGRGAVLYHRWHGTPRVYWSRYDTAWLKDRVQALDRWPAGTDHWCIFDNTAAGAAVVNALELRALPHGEVTSHA